MIKAKKAKTYIDKILLHPKKKKFNPYSYMKPEGKDNNFNFTNCISYNIVENVTQLKNREISSTNLNLFLLGNLSLYFTQEKITTKNNKLKEKTNDNNYNRKNKKIIKKKEIYNCTLLDKYECYIPTKRIPFLNKKITDIKNLKKDSNKNVRKNYKDIKIPSNLRNINLFRPIGKFFSSNITNSIVQLQQKNDNNINNNMNLKNVDCTSEALNSTITFNNNICEDINENDSSGDYSIINESSDNIFREKEFMNLLKKSTTFPKYRGLTELIECPLEDPYSPEIRCNNFIKLLEEFINDDTSDYIEDNSNNNSNYITNFTSNTNQENTIINLYEDNNLDINNNKSVFIINPSNNKTCINDIDKLPRTSSKSGKLLKVDSNMLTSFNNSSIIDKTSMSDDYDELDNYRKDESIFAFFEDENDKKKNAKKIDMKIKRLLPKTALKHVNKMSNQYIYLMHDKFKKISDKIEDAKTFICDNDMVKKFFVQKLKEYLLNIGISSKKINEKIIKFALYTKEEFDFEFFMSIFDIIFMDNSKENLRFKFLLLLNIIKQNDENNEILVEKQINMFFDLIECERVYIRKFCEKLGERLILRYKAIYRKKNSDKNIQDKKFIYAKLKIILESFLDVLGS